MIKPAPTSRGLTRFLMSSRAVLWVGFGSLIVLMVLIASSASRALGRIEESNAQIRQGFLQRDELLNRLRNELYRSSIDVRDYLMHPDPALAELRRAEIQRTQKQMDGAIEQYRKDRPPEEAAAVDQLRRDLNEYFGLVEPVLHWDAAARKTRGPDFLRTEMFPRRQQLLQLSERIREIDSRQLSRGEVRVANVFAGFRREILLTALLTVLFGMALAFLAIGRVQALERESELRFRQVVLAREELHKLSARIVSAQEEERRNLSRELHDEVGQSMSALLVELGNLDSMLPPGNASAHEQLQRVRKLAETNVGVVRNMALLLRPSMLDDLGLVPALKWQAREVARRTGMKVRVDAEDVSDDLPDQYRTCIYRVVQEALHNATRHSKARHIRVTVRREPAGVHAEIQDDGAGFPSRREKGMGILGMEERVRHLGGEFHVESEPGHGTSVSIRLPLQQDTPQPAAKQS
ncbi:MAG: histidine kinase [Candidatus Sulfopaludibacter sp.]|nr:histidine kinase [Candidatus Sulfopaludibacter sp.]